MRTILYNLLIACSVATILVGCNDNGPLLCTEEFRLIGVSVTGDTLTRFYTVRPATGDTIEYTDPIGLPESNWYTVLTDNYQQELEGMTDVFRFYGEVDAVTVIDEEFVIGADGCHIYKVSGPSLIEL